MKNKKIRVLIVDDFDKIRELIGHYLTSEFSVSFDQAESIDQAIAKTSSGLPYNLIICDNELPSGTAIDLMNHLRSHGVVTPVAIMTSQDISDDQTYKTFDNWTHIDKPFSREQFLSVVSPYLDWAARLSKDYIPVSLELLLKIKEIPVPLHIQINPQRFVQLTQSNSLFSEQEFKKYKDRELSNLHILAKDAAALISIFEREIVSRQAWDAVPIDEASHVVSLHTKILKDLCDALGWDERLVRLAEQNIKRALYLCQSQPKLSSVLSHFQRIDRLGFADHCVLNALISTQLASQVFEGSEQAIIDLTIASLFHDFSLTDDQFHDEKKMLKQVRQVDAVHQKDAKDFLAHPLAAAELCNQWAFCPNGAIEAIRNHHELPDGTGFPQGLAADKLDLLSSVFIVAEDLTMHFIESYGKPDLKSYFSSRKSKFNKGNFAVVFAKMGQLANG